jgi:spore coat polysaccharide biosynthesis predicted glycosyltransferase SpsG
MGHLVRMQSLADELVARGHSVEFLTETPAALRTLGIDHPHETVNGSGASLVSQRDCDVTVLDIPSESTAQSATLDTVDLEAELDAASNELVVVHDYLDEIVCCDVLVNGHVYAERGRYDWRGTEPEWLLGLDYHMLPERIRELASRERETRDQPEFAVVTMGGSDVTNKTPVAMRAFDGHDLHVDVIIGPGFTNHDVIRATGEDVDCSFAYHEEPDNFGELLARADVAVSALGLTAYEILALGTPLVGLNAAPDQQPKIAPLRDAGAAVTLANPTTETIADAVSELLSNPGERRTLASRGRALIDGNGCERVCDCIERRYASKRT